MKLRYRARHVTEFCLLAAGLAQPESPYSFGVFLNSLIKYGRDSEYYLPLMHLPFEIRLLGNNTAGKNIVIDGGSVSDIGIGMWGGRIEARGARVGDLGRILSGGEIVIDGDAAEPIGGKMGSGRIVVKGNVRPNPLKTYQESAFDEVSAGFGTGFLMTGGTIIIEGNALADIGHWMKGGEIHIGRGFESIGDVKAGKIYHKGKLIVDK
jgi:formylmethanofuran dehydrogenase subunit C